MSILDRTVYDLQLVNRGHNRWLTTTLLINETFLKLELSYIIVYLY